MARITARRTLSGAPPGAGGAAHVAELGVVPLAAEWFARASLALRDAGAASAARRAGSLAQEQRARMDADPPLPARAHADADPLTPREREVAELASRGLTNREIARRLTVSVRTVHAHLRTVYDKLGVNDRRRLAALLAAHTSDDRLPA